MDYQNSDNPSCIQNQNIRPTIVWIRPEKKP